MVDSKRLRELIQNAGLKYQYVAKFMGLSRYALSMKLDNKSEFKSSEILVLSKLLGIDSSIEREKIFFANEVDY